MEENVLDQCKNILNKFDNRPLFLAMIKINPDFQTNYNAIKEKLLNKQFSSTSDFVDSIISFFEKIDQELIFDDPQFKIKHEIVKELLSQLKHEFNREYIFSPHSWFDSIISYKKKIDISFPKIPTSIKSNFSFSFCRTPLLSAYPLGKDEMNIISLIQASKSFTREQHNGIISALRSFDPFIDLCSKEIYFNLSSISNDQMNILNRTILKYKPKEISNPPESKEQNLEKQ